MTSEKLSGGCHCGSVRYEVAGNASNAVYCHCIDCAKTSGAAPVAWLCVAVGDFQVISGQMKHYASSSHGTRKFCDTCGCLLLFQDQRFPEDIDITLATLDDARELLPSRHIWTQSKPSWIKIEDGLPQYEQGSDSGNGSDPAA